MQAHGHRLKLIVVWFFIIESVALVYLLYSNKYMSDYFGVDWKSTVYGDLLLYIAIVAYYIILTKILYSFQLISVPNFDAKNVVNFKFELFLLFLACLYFYQCIFTNVGSLSILESEDIIYTPLQKLVIYINAVFRFNFIVYIYACLKDDKDKGKMYWFIIAVFLISESLRGVSFPFFLIFIIEMDRVRRMGMGLNILLLPCALIFVNTIYNLKFEVRYQTEIGYSIFETTVMLIGRLSTLSNASFFINNIDEVYNYANGLSQQVSIYDDYFSRLTPFPSLFGIKGDFLNYGNVVFSFLHGHFKSSNALLYPLQITIYKIEDLIISLIVVSISTVLILFISKSLDSTRKLFTFSVVYMVFFFTQSFYGLLSSYLYALLIFLFFSVLLKQKRCDGHV